MNSFQLQSLLVQDFRLLEKKEVVFSPLLTFFIGPNGAGKTSLLEAIELLAKGESFRASKVEEMIAFTANLSRVSAKLGVEAEPGAEPEAEPGTPLELEALITRGEVQGRKTLKLLYAVNGVRRSKRKFLGNFFSVSFRPEDLRLVEGSPGRRRCFLNSVLSMVDPQYRQALTVYEQALRRLNRLLWQVKEGLMPSSVLSFWHLTMLKHGQVLQEKRQQWAAFCAKVPFPLGFKFVYLPSVISEARIKQYLPKAIAAGHSLIGPQKDDFIITFDQIDDQSLAEFGSRGQQRLGVLWLKVCELEFVKTQTQQTPVLLLDDIFSELDDQSRALVAALTVDRQTVLTSTDEQVVEFFKKTGVTHFLSRQPTLK